MKEVTVRKLDHSGVQVTEYPGRVVRRDERAIVLRTAWVRDSMDLGFVVLEPGDQWVERFYADRWYNIFEIRGGGGRLKGWYCNITRPARILAGEVSAEDLELDLWVTSTGETLLLDEDEFAELSLSPEERTAGLAAIAELRSMVSERIPPFDARARKG
jgi:protein associated with RNAse G/E